MKRRCEYPVRYPNNQCRKKTTRLVGKCIYAYVKKPRHAKDKNHDMPKSMHKVNTGILSVYHMLPLNVGGESRYPSRRYYLLGKIQ